jgi:membrane protease YdiL (CAAX protease family)
MLSARPWKANAILRLFLGVFVCVYGGALWVAVLQHAPVEGKDGLRFYALTASALVCLAGALIFLRKPWDFSNTPSRVGGFLVFLYAGIFLAAWTQKMTGTPGPSVSQMIIAGLSFQGAALLLIAHFVCEHGVSWTEAFGLANHCRQAIMLGVILACLFLPLGMGLQWLSGQVMVQLPGLQLKPQQQEAVQTLQMAVTWINRLALAAVTIVLAPAAEEMLFRGILYPWIKQAGFPRLALWGTALFFAAIHMNLVTFVPLLVLALGLTLLYERTDNLWAPITAHALFNAMNFVILYSSLGPLNQME